MSQAPQSRKTVGGSVERIDFLLECKQTVHGSISLKGEWLAKVTEEARAVGAVPAIEVEVKGISDPMCERKWVAVPRSVFERLVEALQVDNH